MNKDINTQLDIPDKMYNESVTVDMYLNDSEDNNIRIRRQTTENIYEHEDNKNSNINEVKPNSNSYDIELGEYIKQEIKNINPKNKNIRRIICGFIFFILTIYILFQKFIELLSRYDDWYLRNISNNDDVYINNLRNEYHTEIAYTNGTEYYLRVNNNVVNNKVYSLLDHIEN